MMLDTTRNTILDVVFDGGRKKPAPSLSDSAELDYATPASADYVASDHAASDPATHVAPAPADYATSDSATHAASDPADFSATSYSAKNFDKTFDKTPRLIICPTPIGNLGDITERTLQALAHADVVFAEDTRVTGKLLAALGVLNSIERLDEATMNARAEGVIARVQAGDVVAYCSDAGMPGVSDPGLRLVAAAQKVGVRVEVLPGASALTCAYVASGFTCPRFYFHGFFPRKNGEQMFLLSQLKSLDACLIFYESPRRVAGALEAIAQKLPHRRVAVCRELTKLHEEIATGAVVDVAREFAEREARDGSIKGEIVIVVDAPNSAEFASAAQDAEVQARERARELRESGMRNKEIAKQLACEFNISRNVAYDIALQK